MSFVDARSLADGARLETPICIVGAGAAGITLARRLRASGHDVLLVEAGGLEPDAATQALHDAPSLAYPLRPNYMARARQFGGTCNLWAGRCMRLWPQDLAARAGIAPAWPIPFAEIEAEYAAAARELDLPELRWFEPAAVAERLTAAERALLREPTLAPTVSVWAQRPMRFGPRHRRSLAADRQLRVLLHANVVRLRLDPAGRRVVAVAVRTLAGHGIEIAARRVVLACGGMEVARLLLLSNDVHPAGIGNEHGLVGRFFMDHPRAVFGRAVLRAEAALRVMRGLPVPGGRLQLGLAAAPTLQAREGLLNHYLTFEAETSGYVQANYDAAVQVAKTVLRRGHAGSRLDLRQALATRTPELIYLLNPKELLPGWAYRLLYELRERLPRRPRERRFALVYFCEQPADAESRVSLIDERDALGERRLGVAWRIAPQVSGDVERLQGILAAALERHGLGHLEPGQGEPAYTDASHHLGTARMSADPAAGVVDADCRVHGVANLWIASSATFPSGGHANPTLTIVALALRLARHLDATMR